MYSIYMFDGLILPELVKEGGGNDIGTGDAMTSFAQLPGGGFLDNYGANISPQNIRPITRECVLFGDTTDELFENFKALRAKIGKRGRLTVAFDNGELWWQWARLQRMSTPRNLEARVKVLACGLTFITASQQWYGNKQSGDTWVVGDDSFYLGDGSVSLGMNDYSYDIGPSNAAIWATLINAGNTFVRNLQIELQTDENILSFSVDSEHGQYISWENPGLTGAFTLLIDCAAKSCMVRMDQQGKAITQVRGYGAVVRVWTTAAHGLTTGASVQISGAGIYDGIHHDITVTGPTFFTYPIAENPDVELLNVIPDAASVTPLVDGWAGLTVYDRKNWFMLYPGDNRLAVNHYGGDIDTQLQDYAIRFRYYDHYR